MRIAQLPLLNSITMDFENTYENDKIQQAQDPNLQALHRLIHVMMQDSV